MVFANDGFLIRVRIGRVGLFIAVLAERFSAGTSLSETALLHDQIVEFIGRQMVIDIVDG